MDERRERGHGGGPEHGQADGPLAFGCATCGAPLTRPLLRMPAVPEAPYYAWWEADEPGPSPSTVPSGHYAIETEPYGAPLVVAEVPGPVMPRHGGRWNADGEPLVSQGPRGNIVINPDDARGLELRHASAACCGRDPGRRYEPAVRLRNPRRDPLLRLLPAVRTPPLRRPRPRRPPLSPPRGRRSYPRGSGTSSPNSGGRSA